MVVRTGVRRRICSYQEFSGALSAEETNVSHVLTPRSFLLGYHVSPCQGSKHQGAFCRRITVSTMMPKAWSLPYLHLEFRGGRRSKGCGRRDLGAPRGVPLPLVTQVRKQAPRVSFCHSLYQRLCFKRKKELPQGKPKSTMW